MHLEMGSAPAPGAANGTLAVGVARGQTSRFPYCHTLRGQREGAPTSTRGACAPPALLLGDDTMHSAERRLPAGSRHGRSGNVQHQAGTMQWSRPERGLQAAAAPRSSQRPG